MFCEKCGKQMEENWKNCPNCGTSIKENVSCQYEEVAEQMFEISAGDVTVSGQRRLATEVIIKGESMTIKSYMNTKKLSLPTEYKIIPNDMVNMEKSKRMVLRKIHKIRLVCAGILLILGVVAGVTYATLVALLLTLFTALEAREKALELVLKSNQKIYIYYIDEDDIVLIEQAINNWKTGN